MDQKTKTGIWEAFRDELIQEGINSPDELIFKDKIPPDEELKNNHSFLKKIGRFKKITVWLLKTAIYVGTAIIIYADMPDAWEKIKTRHPQTFEVVDNVGKAINYYRRTTEHPFSADSDQYLGEYVVFNDIWTNNRIEFFKDIKALNNTGHISNGSILVPASEIDASAIISTDASASLSDIT